MTGQPAKIVALIPARGGSKGLPGKNIRPLLGKPLIAYTIDAARQCPGVDAVYVSTEDTAIRCVSEEAGATVVERPDHLANDVASTLDVVRHFLDWRRTTHGAWPETLVLLQPTSPLRDTRHIQEALQLYGIYPRRTDAIGATMVSVTQAKPLSWQGGLDSSGQLVFHDRLDTNRNRQAEAANYVLNGALYISAPERFYNDTLMQPALYPYVMPADASVDIDTAADFELAEFILYRRRLLENDPAQLPLGANFLPAVGEPSFGADSDEASDGRASDGHL